MTGRFVVIDGGEGCGKSTQIQLLAEHLRALGHVVTVTREPGGTPVGERIRALLLDPAHPEMDPVTEVLLFCASRAQHCRELILPALERGEIVLCDRFSESTAAYQGFAGGLGFDIVRQVNDVATGGLEPDLLVILDLDPIVGLRRKAGEHAHDADRIEQRSLDFHQRVREGFLEYARMYPGFTRIVDASAPADVVHEVLRGLVAELRQS